MSKVIEFTKDRSDKEIKEEVKKVKEEVKEQKKTTLPPFSTNFEIVEYNIIENNTNILKSDTDASSIKLNSKYRYAFALPATPVAPEAVNTVMVTVNTLLESRDSDDINIYLKSETIFKLENVPDNDEQYNDFVRIELMPIIKDRMFDLSSKILSLSGYNTVYQEH